MKIGQPDDKHSVYIGMHRPSSEALNLEKRFAGCYREHCPRGHVIQVMGDDTRCWMQGCWDVPIYVSLEELIAAGWQPQKKGDN